MLSDLLAECLMPETTSGINFIDDNLALSI